MPFDADDLRYLWAIPAGRRWIRNAARLSQQREAARQQWRHLRRLSVAAEPLFGGTVENPRPFSPLDFRAPPLRFAALAAIGAGGRNGMKAITGCGAVAVCPVGRKRDERKSVFIACVERGRNCDDAAKLERWRMKAPIRCIALFFCLLTLTGMRDPFRRRKIAADSGTLAVAVSGRGARKGESDGRAFLKTVSKNGGWCWKKGRRWKTVGRLSA